MTEIRYDDDFEKVFKKLDNSFKIKVKKQIVKIIENPEIGKPLKYSRKNTKEVYISPMRLYYCYHKGEDIITILELGHKRDQ